MVLVLTPSVSVLSIGRKVLHVAKKEHIDRDLGLVINDVKALCDARLGVYVADYEVVTIVLVATIGLLPGVVRESTWDTS